MEEVCKKTNNLYKNINSNNIFNISKEDYLNPDVEDAVYLNITTENIYKILNDELVINAEKNNISLLAAGDGRMAYIFSILYDFNKMVYVENLYELCYLSKKMVKPNVNRDIKFLNKSLLAANLDDKDIIILNYNNVNTDFNNMLENKIIDESKSGSLIIKMATPFRQNVGLKLLKITKLKNHDANVLVFYYKNEG